MSRMNSEKKLGAGRVVAVAIENNKSSQQAAKWAVENLLPKDQCLLLIHVRQRSSSSFPSSDHVGDNETRELFESFRVFCNRKSIQSRQVLLEDMDISKGLVEAISTNSVELLVLGAPSKAGLVRRFRTTDVPSSVSKGAPLFCTVYIISKGKISSVRSATAPLPANKAAAAAVVTAGPPRNTISDPPRNYPPRVTSTSTSTSERTAFGNVMNEDDIISPFTRTGKTYQCSKLGDSDISFVSGASSEDYSSQSQSEEMECEMKRLKLELKQTMDMYSTACKEAMRAKQKAMELQRWKAEEQKASLIGHGTSARYRRYSIEEIEKATNMFSESLKIGEGGYGAVYRCELDCTQVAIKVLKPDATQGREQFQQEVEVLSSIRHPNMVLLLGACPEYGCLVYEYMANGSLDECLFPKGKSRPPLPWQLRFQIASEIATGILFLHQTKPEPLVHRDLKPGNILLDRNYVSKISDVGLARLVPPSVADTVTQYRMTSTAGTFCYIDPEYQQTGMLGIKSDVYSLGIMLLQLLTAKPPMGLTHHVERSIQNGTFAEMLDPSIQDWPLEQTLHFAKLSLACSEMRRKDRPDLGKLVLPELNKLRDFAEQTIISRRYVPHKH